MEPPLFELETKIKLDQAAIDSPNLCERFTAEDLKKLGDHVYEGYERDEKSRSKWKRRTQAAMDLAMQVQTDKSFPWPGCSNVAFPLITIGALNFHSRAYPAIISGTDVVKCRVNGEDPTGNKTRRANRISSHMSWQVLEEQAEWEEQKDRLLINLPIVGTCFTKSFWDYDKGRKVDETVLAADLVIDYWAKSVESCPRKTHIIPFFRNQIHGGIKRGLYRDVSSESWYSQPPSPTGQDDGVSAKRNNRMGMEPAEGDETTPYIFLEQHIDLDLDGDGYAEPYIITVEKSSHSVIRIVTGFDREADITRNAQKEIVTIRRIEYFTKYEFIPSPDGGIYGVGFGVLLGPLNEATNSLINQMIDAGTMRNTAGGFLGRGAKMRGGVYTFAPFQWQRVDSSGDDLRKSVVPLPTNEPSTVLFQLLSLLINYVERLSGTTDPMVGENPGQNTTAETMRTMVQEGQRVYSAVFKRIWRSMKEEFKKDYVLNGIHLPTRRGFGSRGAILREDYLGNPDDVAPAADPNITSDQMAVQQAITLKQAAASTPGYNTEEVERRFLKALKIDGIDTLYPGVSKTGQPEDVKIQVQRMKAQVDMAWLEAEKAKFAATIMEEMRVNDANILKTMAEVQNMQQTQEGDAADRQIAVMNAHVGMMKQRGDLLLKQLDIIIKSMEVKREQVASQNPDGGNVRRLGGASGNGSSSKTPAREAA
jgi:chaperonin GroES